MLLYRICDSVKGLAGKSTSAKKSNGPGKAAASSIVSFVSDFATFEGKARSMVIGRAPMPMGNRGDSAL